MSNSSTGKSQQIDRDSADDPNVMYCTVAVIDLLGFSAHLETGAHDLRTTIGRAAVDRLTLLEEAASMLREERSNAPWAYPESLTISRINDALILAVDLPERLKPGVGEAHRRGYSGVELQKHFSLDDYLEEGGEHRFSEAFVRALQADICELTLFVGLVARLHAHISHQEAKRSFPGVKTICCTGFRRRFTRADGHEDPLSANFAFANAFVADSSLHGPRLYVEDGITELLFIDEIARNVLRYGMFVYSSDPFDATTDPVEGFYAEPGLVVTKPMAVRLFRKEFFFRSFSPHPITHLQAVPSLRDLIASQDTLPRSLFSSVRRRLATGPDLGEMREGKRPDRLLFAVDLTFPIDEYVDIAKHGKSDKRDRRLREEMINGLIRE